jgi:hypothetical protein
MKYGTSIQVILVLICLFACKKQENEVIPKITYPVTYDGNLNLLIDSTFFVQKGMTYSLAANLPKGTSIKVECKPTNNKDWGGIGFVSVQRIGYNYHDYYPNSILYEAEGEDKLVNVPVMFGGSATSVDFYIFENDSTSAIRIKTIRTN